MMNGAINGSNGNGVCAAKRKVAIVIPFNNHVEHLELTLRSVSKTITPGFDVHMLLFDNASTERLDTAILDSLRFRWTLIQNETNELVSKPWNAGIRMAMESLEAEAVCLLNSDVFVGDRWIDHCILALDRGALCSFPFNYTDCGPMPSDFHQRAKLAAEGAMEEAFTDVRTRLSYQEGEDYYAGEYWDEAFRVEMHETDGFSGFCFWLSRKCVEKIGYIDEGMVLCYSDTDYRNRLVQAGHAPVCVHSCLLHHFGSVTVGPLLKTETQKAVILDDKHHFERKWPDARARLWRGHCIGKTVRASTAMVRKNK